MTKAYQFIGSPLLLLLSGCATGTINDLHSTGGGRTYDVPYANAYRIVLDALEELKFSVKKDDPSQGEIRAQTDRYKNGLLLCRGNLLGIFLTQVGGIQTRVEIQSLYVVPHDDWACQDKAQQTISEITKRLRESSAKPSVQSQPVPMAVLPSRTRPEVPPRHVADQLEAPAKKNLVRSEFDFRKATWGMTKEQVRTAEIAHLETQNDTLLVYSDKVAGKDVRIGYIFMGDQLVRSKYVFFEKHTNWNLFINDYLEIKEILTKKYGQPVEDKPVWSNELYRDDPKSWGTAVGVGHLRFVSNWDTPTTSILHVLMGDNFKISLVTEYASKELRKIETQSNQDKALLDF
ncbi:MAG: hypothetical protein IPP12_18775 [Nitrospira sp.]|nr:hypothetical protein [Nitrospira sp.]